MFWCVVKYDALGAAVGFIAGNCLCTKLGVTNPLIYGGVGAVALGGLYSWAARICPRTCTDCRKPSNPPPAWLCNLPFIN